MMLVVCLTLRRSRESVVLHVIHCCILQQGMYQGGYAGQPPQPVATPPSSAGPTPGNQSNPYARGGGGGPGGFGGYPKPAQPYPGYKWLELNEEA